MTATLVAPREPKLSGMPTSGIIVIAGEPKSGKTKFMASFPNSYILELDKGDADRIGGRIHDVADLDELQEILPMVVEDSSVQYIGIDTVDTLGTWMEAVVAKESGVEFLGKPTAGVDSRGLWGEYAQRVRGMTDYLKHCGKPVLLGAHVRAPDKDDQGRITKPAGIKVRGAGGDYIIEQACAIGHMRVKTINDRAVHSLSFKAPSDQAIWRSRVEELQDREFIIKKEDPYGSFYSAAFGKQQEERPAPALKQPVANGNGHKPVARAAAKRR